MKKSVFFVFGLLMLILFTVSITKPVSAKAYPDVIPLPNGFRPEGIVIGHGHTAYAGSLANGDIYVVDLRSGAGEILVQGPGTPAVGLSYDRRSGYLFVSGGPNGDARIYDTGSGELVMAYQLTTPGTTFINDVIVTRQAAYLTDSFNPFIYRIPLSGKGRLPDLAEVEQIPLSDDFVFLPGEFNANGIEASANGRYLIVVNSSTGTLYRVDPNTGDALAIELGGDVVTNGDGLIRQGNTLYVVRNFLNQIAVVKLDSDFTNGVIVDTITSDAFRIPTTADVFGSSLYAVNARFDTTPTPDTAYEIVRVQR
jgi:sugar lactone lactonase YvrE